MTHEVQRGSSTVWIGTTFVVHATMLVFIGALAEVLWTEARVSPSLLLSARWLIVPTTIGVLIAPWLDSYGGARRWTLYAEGAAVLALLGIAIGGGLGPAFVVASTLVMALATAVHGVALDGAYAGGLSARTAARGLGVRAAALRLVPLGLVDAALEGLAAVGWTASFMALAILLAILVALHARTLPDTPEPRPPRPRSATLLLGAAALGVLALILAAAGGPRAVMAAYEALRRASPLAAAVVASLSMADFVAFGCLAPACFGRLRTPGVGTLVMLTAAPALAVAAEPAVLGSARDSATLWAATSTVGGIGVAGIVLSAAPSAGRRLAVAAALGPIALLLASASTTGALVLSRGLGGLAMGLALGLALRAVQPARAITHFAVLTGVLAVAPACVDAFAGVFLSASTVGTLTAAAGLGLLAALRLRCG